MNLRPLAILLLLATPVSAAEVEVDVVCFTPAENCTRAVVEQIGAATASVDVQAYNFSSQPITDALVNAKRRGVAVRVILDESDVCFKATLKAAKSGRSYVCRKADKGHADQLVQAGIPVWVDTIAGIAHNKVMVLDGIRVLTGSFNFTPSAQARNAENLLVVRDGPLADKYLFNWQSRAAVAVPYGRSP